MFLGCGSSQPVVESPPTPPPATTAAAEAPKADPLPSAEVTADAGEYLADPSATPPPAKATFSLEGNTLVLPSPITFQFGGFRIRKESLPALEHIARYLMDKDYITLMRIEGHVDDVDSASENQLVSEARALAVSRWLVKRGIDCTRLLPVGFGWNKPMVAQTGPDPERAKKNTRILAVNAEFRGREIGGMDVEGGGNRAGDPCK
jgi:OOP family OmpA-OmpF porin